jgi:hypothetical protein
MKETNALVLVVVLVLDEIEDEDERYSGVSKQ